MHGSILTLDGILDVAQARTYDDAPSGLERLLVMRFADGDASAFDELVRLHREHVARLAGRLLGWSGDVEDVVQEVFLSAYHGLPRFRSDASLSTWLTTITLNHCRRWLRRRRLWTAAFAWLQRHHESSRWETTNSTDQRLEQVRRAMQQLTAHDREVLVLRYLEEMPVDAMAHALGQARNAVEVRLTRARQRLRALLESRPE